MRSSTLLRGPGPLRVLGTVVVAALLTQDLSAAEPSRRQRLRERPIPPRGRFFVPPALPNPFPNPIPNPIPLPDPVPLPPGLSELGVTGPNDRCLVIAPPIDPRSIKTADVSIDPGIFVRPRVQGLPIRGQSPGERFRR